MPLYRIVIADDDASEQQLLTRLLSDAGHAVLTSEPPAGATGSGPPDLVLLAESLMSQDAKTSACPSSEGPAIVLIASESAAQPPPPSLLAGIAMPDVVGCLVRPISRLQLLATVEVAVSRRREMRALKEEALAATDALDTRKLVDRAKAMLIAAYQLSETDALRRLQTQSMNSRKTMREVAQAVVNSHGRATSGESVSRE